ncbi:hypothetical protein ABO242_004635 [Vibrio parahaemolyticus]|jgi:hypothetical protein|nr:hypothetical protein [Vibrio parahaemolyticus]HCG9474656.1 hypothetical protein [Vibrio parahaemolyticus]HCH1537314.1 hypothetical protein [Vibrio parahaemolyticus]
MTNVNFPAARNHPILHAAPTFRPIRRGRRRKGIENVYKAKSGTLKVAMFHELDIADQDLLLCVLSIARSEMYREFIEQNSQILEALELDLKGRSSGGESAFALMDLPAIKLSLSRYELLKELQKTTGAKNYDWLKDALRRLSLVNFSYDGEYWSGSFNLMSYRFNEESEQFDIYINPISAHSIYASGYVFINRTERHLLNNDASRALHAYLSGVVRLGESRFINLDTMASYVFAAQNEEPTKKQTERRRAIIKESLNEIGNTLDCWDVSILGKGKTAKANIKRKDLS